MTTGWIAEATKRWELVADVNASTVPKLSAKQLADRLDRNVTSCRLWNANWRNRIYRVTFGDGTKAVAKQACVGDCQELDHEFHALHALARLPLGEAVATPAPIAYLSELRTYLMEFVSGMPVDALVRRGHPRQLLEACQLAGRALATIHGHWTREIREIPVDDLVDDLGQLALHLPTCDELALAAVIDNIRGQVVPVGQPFLDYKPANVIYDHGQIWVIDPPEQKRQSEILLWDVAVFGRGLRHELCKSLIRRSRLEVVQHAVDRFERAYRQAQPLALPSDSFRLLVDVLELQRLGQLIALQRGKCRRARLDHSRRRFFPTRYLDATFFSAPLPLLNFQAHRLIKRLTSSLSSV